MAVSDSYAAAKANLRDNVKTLIGVFGAVAGVILVGSPFTGYGALEPGSQRWWVATCGITVAAVLVGLGVYVLMRVLRPEVAYPSALRASFDPKSIPWMQRFEVDALRKEFEKRKKELLSEGKDTVEEQERAANEAWDDYDKHRDDLHRKRYDDVNDPLIKLGNWSAFVRLHHRTTWGTNVALVLGLLALFCLAAFAWAVGAKPSDSGPVVIVVPPAVASAPAAPSLPSPATVYFATGEFTLDAKAYPEINRVRNDLLATGDTSLLIYAHTDTVGGPGVNVPLARKRQQSVVNALMGEGGIARSRLLTAQLPETALPVVTEQEKDMPANRAVRMVFVRLPR
jgi:outer membrane protein OmpA-like peptidoglycan-associated protein